MNQKLVAPNVDSELVDFEATVGNGGHTSKENINNVSKPKSMGDDNSRINPTYLRDDPEISPKPKSGRNKSGIASSSEYSDSIQFLSRSIEKHREASKGDINNTYNTITSNGAGSLRERNGNDLSSSISNLRESLKAGNMSEFSRSASKGKLNDSVDSSSDGRRSSSFGGGSNNVKDASNPDDEMGEIDRRIKALQNYLDKARSGILNPDE